EIRIGVVDVEILREDAILDVGEFPSAERAAGLRGVPGLRKLVTPVRSDRARDHAVARLELAHARADLVHDSDRLMTESQIFARADRAVNGMRIGGADERHGGLDDRVAGARPGNWF